ncbi:N-formylglutamate amidohydrolase [Nitrospirillum sp. BR 11752]|uniref:N-formylglutamate amidohydrolase n=1 Tax=Nitrospirillum sp. BR 11752 TaxID=3104293 RepID=UPI002EA0A635|nr:N-formylglutamate amidohydrolase [Nitrospirillum sp. BR 11752]
MKYVIDDVLVRHDPEGTPVPVVYDSPHSGSAYPLGFTPRCPLMLLRQSEDAHVDELFARAPALGATLLQALFPRSYIDVNRAEDDIDPACLADPWPGPLNPSEKSRHGMGLVRTVSRPGEALYAAKLTVREVQTRIERYWRPYHAQLKTALDGLHARFGQVWHLNCHSMPTLGTGDAGADFVLGDRDGACCDPSFSRFVAAKLRGMGYRVRHNDPYKGVELVRRYGVPTRGRHSLQLEIDRRLYMDEETLERHDGYWRLSRDLEDLMRAIHAFALARVGDRRLAAE